MALSKQLNTRDDVVNILISGATGLIGAAFQQQFHSKYHLQTLHRGKKIDGEPFWDIDAGVIDFAGFQPDVVLHLAGENIAAGRWSDARKKRILDSRVLGTRLLVKHLCQIDHKPHTLLASSAIGYYGLRDAEVLDESSAHGQGFVTDVCLPWEAETEPAKQAGIRVVNMRTGVVMSPKGGALAKMLPAFRFGLGGKLGNGQQYFSWISMPDMLGAIDYLLQHDDVAGPVNMTAPNPVMNAEFTQALGAVLNRPTPFPMPAAVAKLLFGEMAEELLLGGARVVPKKLLEHGYSFLHPTVNEGLKAVLPK